MAHVIVLQVRETLPHEAGTVRFLANQGGTTKIFPFRPFSYDSCFLSTEDERGYLF
ncbi:dipeptidase [Paenibacillus endophyticus]|uniref:Dipeptidase n=1 Tax=Paenibacillus endophyticus TaxID=1294268 RepID=A0A7W5G8D7_9BACL|nr:dipeptidase [Paenibacillus endophyticus]